MSIPQVIIVGADKGGVGKTQLSRALLDYFATNSVLARAFDTEHPNGHLKNYFPLLTEIVDLTDSDGQMAVFDTLGTAVTVIDIRAGLLTPTLKALAEIGFLDPSKIKLTVMHILGSSQVSVGEVQGIMESISTSRYVPVANRINDTKFAFPSGSLDIPKLDEKANEAVDKASMSFSSYVASKESGVLCGKVNHWLKQVFAEFDKAKLNAA